MDDIETIYGIKIPYDEMLVKELPLTLKNIDGVDVEFDKKLLAKYKYKANALKNIADDLKIAKEKMLFKVVHINKKLRKLKEKFATETRPRVKLTLESGEAIEIDGGRTDKDNFKEESDRLLREGLTDTIIKDADNIIHEATQADVFNGYTAIVDNFAVMLQGKWAKEAEINACTTIEELEAVEI